jgi:AcrR family transcriptional regulator
MGVIDPVGSRTSLPIVGQPAAERADAARNRRALLAAARIIVADCGFDGLSLDRLAAQAGVGIGTVYRRFGDRSGLAFALLDEDERSFQEAYLFGPAPLGPGAPPAARIRAFMHTYVDRLDTQADLHAAAASQSPTARYRAGAYQVNRTHLISLLTAARPSREVGYLADALLALLDARLFLYQRRDQHMHTDQIKRGIDALLTRLGVDI